MKIPILTNCNSRAGKVYYCNNKQKKHQRSSSLIYNTITIISIMNMLQVVYSFSSRRAITSIPSSFFSKANIQSTKQRIHAQKYFAHSSTSSSLDTVISDSISDYWKRCVHSTYKSHVCRLK